MILRLLFVLLSMLNIVVGAWLWLGQPYPTNSRPRSDPGVATLRLLSELPPVAATPPIAASTAAAPAGIAPVTSGALRCVALGPFVTPQDLRSARQTLAGQVQRTRARQELVAQTATWWVYLPAARNHATALASARRLADRRISDYFVVSDGDQANSISLGVFKDPANARRRRDEVAAAGFPARMTQRTETVPEYWLDLVLPPGASVDWSAVSTDGVQHHDMACF